MRSFCFLFALLFALPAAAEEPPELRTELVTIKHVDAHDVVQILEAFGSHWGRIQFNQPLNAVTISDQPALVDKMLEVIAQVDVPAAELELTAFLVEASSEGRSDPRLKEALGDVWEELAGLFSYKGYVELDRALLRVTAGARASQALGGDLGYTLEVRARQVDVEAGTFQLNVDLSQRGVTRSDGVVMHKDIVETTLEVRDGKTSVVGASRLHGDDRALITILQTKVVR